MEKTLEYDKKIKHQISDTFLNYFSDKGYLETYPVPLITEDKSVLFTNATIIPWKKYILGEKIPREGVCMNQPCLRLHVLSDPIQRGIEYETSFSRFLGYFNMLGLLTKPENGEKVANDITKLLTEQYAIPKERIKVLSSKKDDFTKPLEGIVKIEYDTKQDSFYHWSYGTKGFLEKEQLFVYNKKMVLLRRLAN
ncbi:MAG: alanyl-tRNA synthetase [Candidatus Woesearchaeota archaeon]|nr:alanyl-tRNA synthetase [Candidatus Woesearchaeota archaeon]